MHKIGGTRAVTCRECGNEFFAPAGSGWDRCGLCLTAPTSPVVEQPEAQGATAEPSLDALIGQAAHEAMKALIVARGYADHGFVSDPSKDEVDGLICTCGKQAMFHHPVMVPWEELAPARRETFLATGMAGYRLGFRTHQHISSPQVDDDVYGLAAFGEAVLQLESRGATTGPKTWEEAWDRLDGSMLTSDHEYFAAGWQAREGEVDALRASVRVFADQISRMANKIMHLVPFRTPDGGAEPRP